MIVIDIGNTNIVIGLYVKSKLRYVYRFETKSKKFLNKIKKTINKNNIGKYNIDYSNISTNIKFKIDNLKELGNYLIANTIASIEKYGKAFF